MVAPAPQQQARRVAAETHGTWTQTTPGNYTVTICEAGCTINGPVGKPMDIVSELWGAGGIGEMWGQNAAQVGATSKIDPVGVLASGGAPGTGASTIGGVGGAGGAVGLIKGQAGGQGANPDTCNGGAGGAGAGPAAGNNGGQGGNGGYYHHIARVLRHG